MAQRGAQPGNKNAGKSKLWEQALQRAIRPKDLQEVAETVLAAAKAGQQWAVQEIGNRLDGKPVQQIEGNHTFTNALANELTNEQLAHVVATGRLPGADEAQGSIN